MAVAAALMTGITSPALATTCDASDFTTFRDCWGSSATTVRLTSTLTIGGNRFDLASDTNATKTIDLNGAGLTVQSGFGVPVDTTLTITDTAEGEVSGLLRVTEPPFNRAGIGGGVGENSGTIIIDGAAVEVTGGNRAAGIGGGGQGSGGTIEIRAGADVTATGGAQGAGIGGGYQGAGGTITIEGANTIVDASGGSAGAGIGGGDRGNGGSITINGGIVTATGGDGATISAIVYAGGAGIGGGGARQGSGPGSAGTLTIDTGNVTARGGAGSEQAGPGAGVGGGGSFQGNVGGGGGTSTVNDGQFTAIGGTSLQPIRNAPGVGATGQGVSPGTLVIAGRALQGTRNNGGAGGAQGGSPAQVTFDEDALVWAALLADPDVAQGTGYASLRFADEAPAEITTNSLPEAAQGQPYSAPITTTGAAPVTVALTSGALPAGLTLTGNTITGTPTESGSFNPEFTASNTILGLVQSNSRTLPLTVAGAGPGPTPTKERQQLRAKQVPKRIKPQGATVLNRRNATTREGVPVRAAGLIRGMSARGDVRCHRLISGPGRKLTIRTNGRCAFTLVVRYRAKATDEYRALNIKQRYRVKKAKRFR